MRLLPALLAALVCTAGAHAQGGPPPGGPAGGSSAPATDESPVAAAPPGPTAAAPSTPATSPVTAAAPVTATATLAPTPATPTPVIAAPAPGSHVRVSWEQRFAQANTTHDGHLTPDQAKAGYQTIARHFRDIDVDNKGYVTVDDVRAWHKAQRAVHRAPAQDGRVLQPQQAFQRSFTSTLQINAPAGRTAAPPDPAPPSPPPTAPAEPAADPH